MSLRSNPQAPRAIAHDSTEPGRVVLGSQTAHVSDPSSQALRLALSDFGGVLDAPGTAAPGVRGVRIRRWLPDESAVVTLPGYPGAGCSGRSSGRDHPDPFIPTRE